jgi:glyoxylase-like metal-dependent hydrolase (beta-lactamase superfamily II)
MRIDRRAFLATAAAGALAPRLAVAQSGPAFHRFAVGGLAAAVIHDGQAVSPDVTRSVVNATPEQVQAALAAAGIQGTAMATPFNITVVTTPIGLVALDAGRGALGQARQGTAIDNMRAAGIDPAQVAIVAHTHFHGDHIGGLINADGQAVFPNARILVPEREWAFWNDAGEEARATEARRPGFANARRRFAPYQGRVVPFAPGAQIAPGITAVATNGHAPGHTSFLLADGAAQMMVIGDAVTAPAFYVANPDWFPGFDMDPPAAVATRRALLDRLATDRIPAIGYHWDMPAVARVERAGSGYRLVPHNA